MSVSDVPRAYRVVLGIADPHQAVVVRREIDRHPRFEVVRDAPNAVLTLDSATKLQPDVVILSDLSPGIQGRDVIDELAECAPDARVIITVASELEVASGATNVMHEVNDHDPAAMVVALDSTADALDSPVGQVERRTHVERRLSQDWTKVFSERRVTVRRAGDREVRRLDLPYL